MKAFKYRLNLTYQQKLVINTLNNEHRLLYNHLLEQVKQGFSFKQLYQLCKNYRNQNNLTINAKSAQNTYRTLINNCKSYFQLRKNNTYNAKFPYKFKSYKYFCTFTYDFNSGNGGFKIENKNLLIQKGILNLYLPNLPYKINNQTIKTITFKQIDNDYYIIFTYSEEPSNKIINNEFLSIDLGITEIATCFSSKTDSFAIKNNQFKKQERRLKYLQSLKGKYKNGSRKHKKINKRFKKVNKRIKNKNKDFQHKTSKQIIKCCTYNEISNLVIGDISTKKLSTQYNRGLNKSTQNRGTLSRFKTFLKYKAKNAGLNVKLQNEANTSKVNCLTSELLNLNLEDRQIQLKDNFVIDRDLNGAINIAQKFKGKWLTQLEDHIVNFGFHKMFVDNQGCLQTNQSYKTFNLL